VVWAASWFGGILRVLGIDPGTHTGVCLVEKDSDGDLHLVFSCELEGRGLLGEISVGIKIASIIEDLLPDIVVIEDFILVPNVGTRGFSSKREGLSPVRVTAALLSALLVGGWSQEAIEKIVHMQSPSSAKGVITDERLRSAGMWIKGSDHIRDSIRHAMLFLRR
jgi:hypothetical protein